MNSDPKTVPYSAPETDPEIVRQYEDLKKEALENYESWGQWLIETTTKREVCILIKAEGVDGARATYKAIEDYHQDVRGHGGLNDGYEF